MSIGNFVVAGCAIGVAVAVVLSGVAIGNKSEPVLDSDSWGRLVIDKFNKIPDNAYEIDWDNKHKWEDGLIQYRTKNPHSITWSEFRDICAFRISEIHKDDTKLSKIKLSSNTSLVNNNHISQSITHEHCLEPFRKQ